jgi:hypothetical protein
LSGDGRLTHRWDLATAVSGGEVRAGYRLHGLPGSYPLASTLTFARPSVSYLPDSGGRIVFNPNTTNIEVSADSVTLTNVDIVGVNPNRTSAQSGSSPTDISPSFLNINGKHITLAGCRIADIGELFVVAANDGFEMVDTWVMNQGWSAPDRGHGHSFYCRSNGVATLKATNCFFGPGFGFGVHGYGNNTNLIDITIDGLIQCNPLFLIGGEANTPLDKITVQNCLFWGVGTDLGYNTVSAGTLNHLNNRYYGSGSALIRPCWSTVNSAGNVVKSADSVTEVYIRPCTTPGMVAWVIVFNWTSVSAVTVAVPQMVNGQSYSIENSLNPFVEYQTVVYDGVGVTLDFVNRSVAVPLGFSDPLLSLPPKFGVWCVRNV